jgi:hypothetical protein
LWTFHEIAHNLFATAEGRRLPNYGLGTDPGGGSVSVWVRGVQRGRDPDEDESAVCILDLILMRRAGLPDNLLRRHAKEYHITDASVKDRELLGQIGITHEQIEDVLPFLYEGRA